MMSYLLTIATVSHQNCVTGLRKTYATKIAAEQQTKATSVFCYVCLTA